jgi:hypothetical protein
MLERIYERLGPGYPWAFVAFGYLVGTLAVGAGAAIIPAYVKASIGNVLILFLIGCIGMIAVGTLTLWRWLPTIRGTQRWIAEDRPSEGVEDLWHSVAGMPMAIPVFSYPFAVLLIAFPLAAYAWLALPISVGNLAIAFAAALGAGIYGWIPVSSS